MKLKLIVEVDINKREMLEAGVATEDTIQSELQGHIVKVKSGVFENRIYGEIASVEIVAKKKKTIPR